MKKYSSLFSRFDGKIITDKNFLAILSTRDLPSISFITDDRHGVDTSIFRDFF